MHKQPKLVEGLRAKDLKDLVDPLFTVDQYKSKMGEDKDIVVLGFKVVDKYPAIDLMEFIEKGYSFILDADMSTGEERDGKYHVFVEFQRTPKLPEQIKDLLSGIGQLTDCYNWKFRYSKDIRSQEASLQELTENIPLTPLDYENKILEYKNLEVQEFFNQGAVDVVVDESDNMVFTKPYSGNIQTKLVSIGDYETLKNTLPGPIDLSESGQSKMLFLNKYLGPYEINKIGNKFLIRNGNQGLILEKDRW